MTEKPHGTAAPSRDADRHPRQEADTVHAWTSVILMVFGVLVVAGGIWWAWGVLESELARSRPGLHPTYGPAPEERPPAPRRIGGLLQGPVGRGWGEREEPEPPAAAEDLDGWSWADGAHRFARIPIERAMELIVARGAGSPPQPLDPLPSPGGGRGRSTGSPTQPLDPLPSPGGGRGRHHPASQRPDVRPGGGRG